MSFLNKLLSPKRRSAGTSRQAVTPAVAAIPQPEAAQVAQEGPIVPKRWRGPRARKQGFIAWRMQRFGILGGAYD